MYISLNELRQRVTILRPVTVEDGAGNLIRQGEEEVATVWAKVFLTPPKSRTAMRRRWTR